MAIYAYVGLPRNGKSYNVVEEQIVPALRDGRRVVTNIPLNAEALATLGCVGEVVQLDQQELAEKPAEVISRDMTGGSVVVLDELWRFLPQGLQAKNVPQEWKSLFAEHGHRIDEQGRMMQIVLVTQDLSQVAAFARALVERTFVVTKVTSKRFRVDVYQGFVTGLKPPQSKRLNETFGTYKPEIFAAYQSRTMSEAKQGASVNESTLDARASGWRSPMIRFGLPAALLLFLFGGWRTYHFFFVAPVEANEAHQAAKASRRASVVSSTGNRVLSSNSAVVSSTAGRWRISAWMRTEPVESSRVLLDLCDGGPSRWVSWQEARCTSYESGSVVECEWQGRRVELAAPVEACRPDESRAAEIRWFPADAGGSREPVSVVPSKSVDGSGR